MLRSVFSDWLVLLIPVQLQTRGGSRSQARGCRRPLTVSFSSSSYQDERADVRHVAAMGHRADVHPAARYDEASFAGLPQPGPEGRGPDEEGSGADKHRRAAEDGD